MSLASGPIVSRTTLTLSTSSLIGAPPIFIFTADAPVAKAVSISLARSSSPLALLVVGRRRYRRGCGRRIRPSSLYTGWPAALPFRSQRADVNAADDAGGDSPAPDQLGLPHIVPDALGVEGVLAYDVLLEVPQDLAPDADGAIHPGRQPQARSRPSSVSTWTTSSPAVGDVPPVANRLAPRPSVGLQPHVGNFHGLSPVRTKI